MNKDSWKGFLMMLGIWFTYPIVFIYLIKYSDSIFSQVVLIVIGLYLASRFIEWLRGKVN